MKYWNHDIDIWVQLKALLIIKVQWNFLKTGLSIKWRQVLLNK